MPAYPHPLFFSRWQFLMWAATQWPGHGQSRSVAPGRGLLGKKDCLFFYELTSKAPFVGSPFTSILHAIRNTLGASETPKLALICVHLQNLRTKPKSGRTKTVTNQKILAFRRAFILSHSVILSKTPCPLWQTDLSTPIICLPWWP